MRRVVIMGAGGRDFHDFNTVFREDTDMHVVAFTAAQIPGIDDRTYPPSLAGPLYPQRHPDRPRERARRPDPARGRRRSRACVLRPRTRGGHAQGVDRPGGGRRLHLARPALDDAEQRQARDRRHRGAHRLRQEPDDSGRRSHPALARPVGRARAAPDAVRRPRGDAGAALRLARRHRRREAPRSRNARNTRRRSSWEWSCTPESTTRRSSRRRRQRPT